MTASSRGSRVVTSLIRSSRHPRICSDCIYSLSRHQRQYAAAAAVLKSSSDESTPSHTPPVTSGDAMAPYVVKTGILLSRPPLITKELTPFEKAFYFYQKRLNERLAMPFTRYFYFKKDTPADNDWKRKAKERNGSAARELGGYQPYGKLGWNDELLVGDEISEPRTMVETLVKDAMMKAEGEGTFGLEAVEAADEDMERPMKRITEADRTKDKKRLDRKLARTLYLVVKGKSGKWELPSGTLVGRENLHQATERILVQSAGMNMNTWVVGHAPAGYLIEKPRLGDDSSLVEPGVKTFFMRGRIMAGQADLTGNLFGLTDFQWLTRQEASKALPGKYFSALEKIMSDR